MSHLSLATRYRPQKFADVAGQPLAAIALSRAAKAGKIAPAYLLSGTRGVGKTTIARIFAKALNCEKAPTGEPCNECAQCRHITAGNHVDVAEIDGASNTGVDDIRALRETIGFMPMEGRYKIFIIDEAHMLSKSAFNALLKTLEEPPANTVFIFATTEAHRFPATIISRCQHFVFRHLPEQAIAEHLIFVLEQEKMAYEENAVRLIARRAAGSVRDSLSLLDQALSVCGQKLDAETTRQALGVAGPELMARLFEGIAARDCAAIVKLAGELLANGVDLSFFTRELTATLRNLFLLCQAGPPIMATLNLAADEEQFLKTHAQIFSAPHLHAAWQLALESQKNIAQSPAPGTALELLLINMALLPQLLPVGSPAMPPPQAGGNPPAAEKDFAAREAARPYVSTGQSQNDAGADNQSAGDASQSTGEASQSAGEASQSAAKPAPDWDGFRAYCSKLADGPGAALLASLRCQWRDGQMDISAPSRVLWEKLEADKEILEKALARFCNGVPPQISYHPPKQPATREQMAAQGRQKPEIKLCCDILDASIHEYREKFPESENEKHE